MSKYKIYQHLNKDNECIYVGKTYRMDLRQIQHLAKTEHRSEIHSILVGDAINKTGMLLYEHFYINKLNPIYNEQYNRGDDVSFLKLDLINFKSFPFIQPSVSKAKIEDTSKVNYLTEDQREKFLSTFSEKSNYPYRNKLFFELLIYTKLKPHELQSLKWKDITKNENNEWEIYIDSRSIYVKLLKKFEGKLLGLQERFSLEQESFIFRPLTENKQIAQSFMRRKCSEHSKLAGFEFSVNMSLLSKEPQIYRNAQ